MRSFVFVLLGADTDILDVDDTCNPIRAWKPAVFHHPQPPVSCALFSETQSSVCTKNPSFDPYTSHCYMKLQRKKASPSRRPFFLTSCMRGTKEQQLEISLFARFQICTAGFRHDVRCSSLASSHSSLGSRHGRGARGQLGGSFRLRIQSSSDLVSV